MQWELAIDRGIQVCLAGLIPFEILLSHHSIPRSSSLLSRFGEHVGVADRMGDRVARIQQKFLHFFFFFQDYPTEPNVTEPQKILSVIWHAITFCVVFSRVNFRW